MTTTQVAVLLPALLFWIMLIVQYGLWFHAKQVANAAAAEAVDAAQVPGNTVASAEQAAPVVPRPVGQPRPRHRRRRLPPRISSACGSRVEAPQLVPGFDWTVTSVARRRSRRFIPEPER